MSSITTIEITEVYSKRIVIEHDASITDEDILDYVRKQYYNDKIELDYNNYLDTDFNIVETNETVEVQEDPELLQQAEKELAEESNVKN